MIVPRNFVRKLMSTVINVAYLYRSLAPPGVLAVYIKDMIRANALHRRYKNVQRNCIAAAKEMDFSSDWFTANVPHWSWLFDRYDLKARKQILALEIGSYEGRSSVFLLGALDNLRLICVDAWDCSAYRLRGRECDQLHMDRVERRFDENLASFSGRVTKCKATSSAYFGERSRSNEFDLIYVDGPHYCDDVLIDAIVCFDMLKVGGLLIFDDYLWRRYERERDNPAAAINSVLRLKKGMYKVVSAYSQLIIEKTKNTLEGA